MLFYHIFSTIFHYLAPLFLKYRLLKGKEERYRYLEKLGIYDQAQQRPSGFCVHIHGASVGETLSALPIIDNLLKKHPHISIIITSHTRTSAILMQKKLPNRCMHLYAPIDTPQATQKFYHHYQPNIVLVLDSEIWPNNIMQAHHNNIPIYGINGAAIATVITLFSICYLYDLTDKELMKFYSRKIKCFNPRRILFI